MPDLRAIIFDLGGTLWHWPRKDPTRDGAWFWGRAHDHAVQTPPHLTDLPRIERDTFTEAMVAAETAYQRRARTEGRSRTPQDIAADGLRSLGIQPGEEETSAVLEGYGRVAAGWATPFPDAVPTLSRLRTSGYRLGILSNTWWSSRWLDKDLETLGLANLFDEVLYTSDLSHAKPHPSVFLEAARRLDTEPAACVMVGDDPRCDVAGSIATGMWAVWRRGIRPWPASEEAQPTAAVDDLAELPALLRSWNVSGSRLSRRADP